jgi:DNA polymerase-3 subunit epsilon
VAEADKQMGKHETVCYKVQRRVRVSVPDPKLRCNIVEGSGTARCPSQGLYGQSRKAHPGGKPGTILISGKYGRDNRHATKARNASRSALCLPGLKAEVSRANLMMKCIVIDTESTGFNNARLVELAAIEFDPITGATGARFQSYVSPESQKVDSGAYAVHGLSDSFLSKKPLFRDIAVQFRSFIEGAVIYAHNAPFDIRLLNAEFERMGSSPIENVVSEVVCTLKLSKAVLPTFKSRKLDVLCDHYQVDRTKRGNHGALIDCDLLAQVCVHLMRDHTSRKNLQGAVDAAKILVRNGVPSSMASPRTAGVKITTKREGWRPGGPWYEDELASLVDLHGRKINIDAICLQHNRSFLSIAMQLEKLGLITQEQVEKMKSLRLENSLSIIAL